MKLEVVKQLRGYVPEKDELTLIREWRESNNMKAVCDIILDFFLYYVVYSCFFFLFFFLLARRSIGTPTCGDIHGSYQQCPYAS